MFFIQVAQAPDLLHRRLVSDRATKGIAGVGRVNEEAAGVEHFRGLADQARLGVVRMDREALGHGFL